MTRIGTISDVNANGIINCEFIIESDNIIKSVKFKTDYYKLQDLRSHGIDVIESMYQHFSEKDFLIMSESEKMEASKKLDVLLTYIRDERIDSILN